MNTAAVIGMGSIGRRHARNLTSLGFKIFGFDPMGCENIDPEIDVTEIKTAEQAIQISDIVIISSPHSSHLEHMRVCVRHRKPFLVEKPISSMTYGLEDLAESMGDLVAHVGYNLRFHPTVVRARDHLKAGTVGKILHSSFEYGSFLPSWRPSGDYRLNYAASRNDGGIILDDIHEIDLACHLFGVPENVICTAVNTRTLGIAHEEIADISFVGQPGCPSTHIHMDYLQRVPTRRFKLVGTCGTIECDLNTARTTVLTPESVETHVEEKYTSNDMYIKEMVHFLDAVNSEKSDESLSVRAGIQTLQVALLARKSSVRKRMGDI